MMIELTIACSVALLNGQENKFAYYAKTMSEINEIWDRNVIQRPDIFPKGKCSKVTKQVPDPITYDPAKEQQKKDRLKALKAKKMTAEELEEAVKLLMGD